MKKFAEIVLQEDEKGREYLSARFLTKTTTNLTVARAMVLLGEASMNLIPEQDLPKAEEFLLKLFLHSWQEKNKHIER